MSNVAVKEGDKVTKGQRVGTVSNVFGGTPTTVHLHFNIRQNVAGVGSIYVPPYTSLIKSYRELLNPTVPTPAPTAEPAPPPAPPAEEPAPPPEDDAGCACRSTPGPTGSLAAIAAALLLAGAAVVRRRA
jgi:MYXO-CTERM domain-containing protein